MFTDLTLSVSEAQRYTTVLLLSLIVGLSNNVHKHFGLSLSITPLGNQKLTLGFQTNPHL